MAKTIRTAAMRINRARDDGQSAGGANDVFAEGFSITGRANNIVLCSVVPGVDTPFGGIGPTNWWNRTVSITDMTFDDFEMDQAPMALGPGLYTFDVLEWTDRLIDGLNQRIRHRIRGIILPEQGTFDRDNIANRSRPVVIKPTLYVEGGGVSLETHRDGLTRPDHGVIGAQYPFVYCDTEGGPAGEPLWITRLPGQAAVQHLPLRSM